MPLNAPGDAKGVSSYQPGATPQYVFSHSHARLVVVSEGSLELRDAVGLFVPDDLQGFGVPAPILALRRLCCFPNGESALSNMKKINRSLLLERLKPIDRTILSALVDGLAVHDIAERLKISHQSVMRHRERIAELAIKLGVGAPLAW